MDQRADRREALPILEQATASAGRGAQDRLTHAQVLRPIEARRREGLGGIAVNSGCLRRSRDGEKEEFPCFTFPWSLGTPFPRSALFLSLSVPVRAVRNKVTEGLHTQVTFIVVNLLLTSSGCFPFRPDSNKNIVSMGNPESLP
jgi:hypothetical protein